MAKTKTRPEPKALPRTSGRPAPRAPTERDLGIAEGEARASRILLKTDSKTIIRLPHGEALKIGDEVVFATEDDTDVYVISYISANYENAVELKHNPGALYSASRLVLR
jgi:urease accessory protein UreE